MGSQAKFPLPKVFPLRQKFPGPVVQPKDIPSVVRQEVHRIIQPGTNLAGKKIGVTATSRGIANQALVVRSIVEALRAHGANVWIVPSMGSHGKGTPEGERAKLAEEYIGITEESVGAPILDGTETELVDTVDGLEVYCAKVVLDELDGIFIFGRIKEHTDIDWETTAAWDAFQTGATPENAGQSGYWGVESGLSKCIGLGLSKLNAKDLHHYKGGLGAAVEISARTLLKCKRLNVLGGIAAVDNAYVETAGIYGVTHLSADDWFRQEREILIESKKLLPTLPWADGEYDILFVDRAGKEISGQGVATKTVGRGFNEYIRGQAWHPGMPAIWTMLCSNLLGPSANGCGKFQAVTERYMDGVDWDITRLNAKMTGYAHSIDRPHVCENDARMLVWAMEELEQVNPNFDPSNPLIAFIVSTNWMENVWLSEAFLPKVQALVKAFPDRFEIMGEPMILPFDYSGHLILPAFWSFDL